MSVWAWLTGGLVAALLFMAPLIGLFGQPWAPWWLAGTNATMLPPMSLAPGGETAPGPVQAAVPGTSDNPSLLGQVIAPWLGVPYFFGGCSLRGVDCSCFVQQVMARLGVSLPRTAQAQWNATARTSEPQPGDLVFFQNTYDSPDRITHVGFYLSPGVMLSAAEPAVGRQSLDSPFWRAHLAGFGRVHIQSPSQA